MENGEGSLIFAASDLIALSTTPAISIDLQIESPDIEFSRVVKENYLSDDSLAALLKFVEDHATEFKRSKVMGGRRKARKSLVPGDLGDFGEMFRGRIRSDLPAVLATLQIPDFPILEIECEITSHNNDNYFERHRDSGRESYRTNHIKRSVFTQPGSIASFWARSYLDRFTPMNGHVPA